MNDLKNYWIKRMESYSDKYFGFKKFQCLAKHRMFVQSIFLKRAAINRAMHQHSLVAQVAQKQARKHIQL